PDRMRPHTYTQARTHARTRTRTHGGRSESLPIIWAAHMPAYHQAQKVLDKIAHLWYYGCTNTDRRLDTMHLNRIHGILKKAGLKPYNPLRGVHVGYHIYTEQFPFDPVRHVCVYFCSTTPWDKLPLEQAQEAAIAALSMAGLQV